MGSFNRQLLQQRQGPTGINRITHSVAGDYVMTPDDDVLIETSAGHIVSLPLSPLIGDVHSVISQGGANTLSGNGLLINGAASLGLLLNDNATLTFDGANWQAAVANPSGGGSGGGQFNVVLANGLNSNVQTQGQAVVRVGGPTGPYSIDGFATPVPPVGGSRFVLVNTTTQPLTLVNEGAGSAAANRLNILKSGGPARIPPAGGCCAAVYDATAARWVVEHVGSVQGKGLDVRDFGTQGNANFQSLVNFKWYVDAGLTVEATDDTPFIVAAITAASGAIAAGSTSVRIALSGNHYLKTPTTLGVGPLNNAVFFTVPSGVSFVSDGSAILRVGAGLQTADFAVFYASASVANVSFTGITIDGNGQSGAPTTQRNMLIALIGGANSGITLNGCTFQNQSGLVTVILGDPLSGALGSAVTVVGCHFLEIGNSTGLIDHIALYIQANGIVVDGCTWFNAAADTVQRNNGGAFQFQGSGVAVTGNSFTNQPLGVLPASVYTVNTQGVVIAGNTFLQCVQGVVFAQAVGLHLSDVLIADNTFVTVNSSSNGGECAVQCTNVNGGNFGLERLTIVDNVMKYVHDARWADVSPVGVNFLCSLTDTLIADNLVEGYPAGGITLIPLTAANPNPPAGNVVTSDLKLVDVRVWRNLVKDCAATGTVGINIECDTAFTPTQRLVVRDNSVVSTGAALATGIETAVAGDSLTYQGNFFKNVTTEQVFASTNGMTNVFGGVVVGDAKGHHGSLTWDNTNLGVTSGSFRFDNPIALLNGTFLVTCFSGNAVGINAFGMDVNGALRLDSGGATAKGVANGAVSSLTNAAAGDYTAPHGSSIRVSSGATTLRILTTDVSDKVTLNADGSAVDILRNGGNFALRGNATGVGLYGTAPVAQAARAGQLTDNSTGVASGAVADVGAAFSQSGLNNIHASILAKLNAIELALHNLGVTA